MLFFKKYYDSWFDYFSKRDGTAVNKSPEDIKRIKNKFSSVNAATKLSQTPDKVFYTPKARVYNEWSKFEKAVNSSFVIIPSEHWSRLTIASYFHFLKSSSRIV